MCVDAFDVAFVAGEDEIMEKFRRFNHGLVMSTEHDGLCGLEVTQAELGLQCQAVGGYMPNLNMGGWIGERKYVLHVFAEAERVRRPRPVNPSYNYDVLIQWLMEMKAFGGGDGAAFDADWHCAIFQSMNKADVMWDADGKRLTNTVTRTKPCVLHYNGDKSLVRYDQDVKRILA